MPAQDRYGQGVQYLQLSDAPNQEQLGDWLANGIVPKAIMAFDSAAARAAVFSGPVHPEAGMLAWLRAEKRYDYYDGTAWIDLLGGVWKSYSPTWAADGGTTHLGGGTLAGTYARVRNVVHFHIKFQWGADTSQTTGGANWRFSLPANVDPVLGGTFFGCNAWVLDSSINTRYLCGAYMDATEQPGIVAAITPHGSNSFIDNKTPMTWAVNDRLNIWGSFPAL